MTTDRKYMSLTPIKPPCTKNCPNRKFGCHGKCETYRKYRAECDEQLQKRMLESDVKSAIGDAIKRIPGKRGI